jgi:hypothetical protein
MPEGKEGSMPKKIEIKLTPLDSAHLGRYRSICREMADLKRERDELRIGLMMALERKKGLTKDAQAEGFEAYIDSYEKTSIPWQEEAKRWKQIALGFHKQLVQLGKRPPAVAKLTIDYPKVPAKRLIVKLAGETGGDDE